jgi:hypothetical protein
VSHTMNAKIQIRDKALFRRIAAECGAEILGEGTHELYAEQVEGLAIQPKGYHYPVVVDKDGNVKYDNYRGEWGAEGELGKILAKYGAEQTKAEARRQGLTVSESETDEEIEIEIEIGDE